MTEQLQTDYLDTYEGIQAKVHQVSQFAVGTTYLGKVNMSEGNALGALEQCSLT